RGGKIRGERMPGHVHVTGGRVDRKSFGDLGAVAAQVRGLIERRQGGVQVRDEGVLETAEHRLRTSTRAGKIPGSSPGHVHVARRRVDRKSETAVGAAAAQVRALIDRSQSRV